MQQGVLYKRESLLSCTVPLARSICWEILLDASLIKHLKSNTSNIPREAALTCLSLPTTSGLRQQKTQQAWQGCCCARQAKSWPPRWKAWVRLQLPSSMCSCLQSASCSPVCHPSLLSSQAALRPRHGSRPQKRGTEQQIYKSLDKRPASAWHQVLIAIRQTMWIAS